MTERSALQAGLVVASHGRHCMVETPVGERRICHPRGKKNQVVVGDRVHIGAFVLTVREMSARGVITAAGLKCPPHV